MKPQSNVALAVLSWVALFGFERLGYCGLSEVGAGLSMPAPMGNASQTLNRPMGFQAEVWLETPSWLPSNFDFHLDATYQPYTVKNLGTGGIPGNTLNLVGLFAGLQASGAGPWGLVPFFSAEIGGVYDSLSLTGVAGAVNNAGTNFAIQAIPGLDIGVYRKLGVVIETPITVVFATNSVAIWNGSASLRWKL